MLNFDGHCDGAGVSMCKQTITAASKPQGIYLVGCFDVEMVDPPQGDVGVFTWLGVLMWRW